MPKILVSLILLCAFSSHAEAVDFSQKQADITVACANYDISNLWGTVVFAKGSDDTILVKQNKSIFDESKGSKTLFAMKLRKDGSCKKMSRVAMSFLKTGEYFTEANANLFKCPKQMEEVKSAGLTVGEPSIKEKKTGDEFGISKRVSVYPLLSSEGKQVAKLTIRDEYDHGIMDDNDWQLKSCSID